MNDTVAGFFVKALAVQARVVAMQAQNSLGTDQTYPPSDFFSAERELDELGNLMSQWATS